MKKANGQLKLRITWDFRRDRKERKKRSNPKGIRNNKLLKLVVFISSFIIFPVRYWIDLWW